MVSPLATVNSVGYRSAWQRLQLMAYSVAPERALLSAGFSWRGWRTRINNGNTHHANRCSNKRKADTSQQPSLQWTEIIH